MEDRKTIRPPGQDWRAKAAFLRLQAAPSLADLREHFGVREWADWKGVSAPTAVRLLRRVVEREDGCWVWPGALNKPGGYGVIRFHGRKTYTHRAAYELLAGPIPEGLSLDHLCRNPPCCNPAHLEPVTHRENVLRGTSPMAGHAKQTHCKRGHEYTPENTAVQTSGARRCRVCQTITWNAWSARRRASEVSA